MESVAGRLARVRDRIADAERAAGREPGSVQLLAVGKRHPSALIREAYACGQRAFGENYAQELAGKASELTDLSDLEWHMIGNLQRNKVKLVAPVAACVQTVDSVRLANALDARVKELAREPLRVLIEVNVGGEGQKSGCLPSELTALVGAIAPLSSVTLGGLMTIPPHSENPADSGRYFELLSELREQHGGEQHLPELSMGMSADLESAIASGSTMVRVGTAIFGERPPRAT
jgi:PLP dependent protein